MAPQRGLLVVDDEQDIRELLRDTFKREFSSVSEASNTAEALETYSREDIAAVITDVRMPGRSGMELVRDLCAQNSSVPIVVLSAYADHRPEEAYDMGAVALLRKPSDLETIRQVLKRALSPLTMAKSIPVSPDVPEVTAAQSIGPWQAGRGGVFISGNFNKFVSREIVFRLPVHRGAIFEGRGIVKWERPKAAAPYHPGIGVEFTLLTEASQAWLAELMQRRRLAAYIPNGRI